MSQATRSLTRPIPLCELKYIFVGASIGTALSAVTVFVAALSL